MPTASITFTKQAIITLEQGEQVVLDFDWSGDSVSGHGPDDSTPDIGDVRGWIERAKVCVRDLTKDEINRLASDDEVAGYMYERIHEQCQEGPDPDLDRP